MNNHDEHGIGSVILRIWQQGRLYLIFTVVLLAFIFWIIWPPLVLYLLILSVILALTLVLSPPVPREITRKKTTKRQIALTDIPAEQVAGLLSDPLVIFDRSGSVIYSNPAAQAAFPSMEIETIVFLRFRAPEMLQMLHAVVEDGEPRSIDYFERLPIESWYKAVLMPLDAKGKDLFMLIFRDQTEARRIDRMRSDFVANASHELRTPLASLRGFIETLQGPAREDVKARERFLDIMQKQADRMSRLIDDLLSLSRLETRPNVGTEDKIDLGAVLHHVTDSLAPMAQAQGVVIEHDFHDEPVYVAGSRDELIQLFQNLIENGCKYGEGGKRLVVSLKKHGVPSPEEAIISVQDFGAGIAAEHLPRLTERFYRINAETGDAKKGTGLGLAIVKHILTRHRGKMNVRSELGKGTTFIIRLPLFCVKQ
ncbi:ATP-binding protein [Paenochrobactrum sp. BZR 588]|uniref:ATP-binding protein n=1 Tax=unclassified Paenochrobactrum TaxID=2639760 RepID=UPI0038542D5E